MNSQEPKKETYLENILGMRANVEPCFNQKIVQSTTMNNQLKVRENVQLSCLQPGANPMPHPNFGTQGNGKQNNDEVLNSALLENLTALAKLDELTSQSNHPLMDMPNNAFQNIAGNKGDGYFSRNPGQELFHRSFTNMGYNTENYPQNPRYNGQQRTYQQQSPSSNHVDQQSALMQLAAIAAASEQQNSPFGPSPRSMKPSNSPPFSMHGNGGFNTGMVERNRSMAVGGRGSPSLSQYAMDQFAHVQDNIRFFGGKYQISAKGVQICRYLIG